MPIRSTAINRISLLARQIGSQFIEIRRHLYQNTEIRNKEQKADFIKQLHNSFGLEGKQIAKNGYLLELQGFSTSPVVALLINIDSLPIARGLENLDGSDKIGTLPTFLPDIYVAIGLGVIWVLKHFNKDIPGTIRVLFLSALRPNMEDASEIIHKGSIENAKAIFGQYVDPSIPVGSVGVKFGPIFPSRDTFSLRITDKISDTVNSKSTVDQIQVSANIIIALNQLSTRKIDPLRPADISIYSIHSRESNDVLVDSVLLEGMLRTLDTEVQKKFPSLIESTVQGITRAYGAEYQIEITNVSPILVNDQATTMNLKMAAEEVLGKNQVNILKYPRLGFEEFAHYLKHVPGSLLHIGTRSNPTTLDRLQSNNLNIAKLCIEAGVKTLSWAMMRFLNKNQ